MIVGSILVSVCAGCLAELDVGILCGQLLGLFAVTKAGGEDDLAASFAQLDQGIFHSVFRHVVLGDGLNLIAIFFLDGIFRSDEVGGVCFAVIADVDEADLHSAVCSGFCCGAGSRRRSSASGVVHGLTAGTQADDHSTSQDHGKQFLVHFSFPPIFVICIHSVTSCSRCVNNIIIIPYFASRFNHFLL